MGTSANRPGESGRNPIVAPHADAEPGKPVPDRPVNGLRNFRTNMTSFGKSGGRDNLRKAAGSYASGAVGGAATGYRRFGAATTSSGVAIAGMANMSALAVDGANVDADLQAAIGRPIQEAAAIIARAVAPDNSESDLVSAVIQEAIIEACEELGETGDFESDMITPEFLDTVLQCSIVEMIYQDMAVRIAGESMDSATTPTERQARENELHEFISETVDQQMATMPNTGTSGRSATQLRSLQLNCIKLVIAAWEGLE